MTHDTRRVWFDSPLDCTVTLNLNNQLIGSLLAYPMPKQSSLPKNIGYSHVLQQALQLGNNQKSFARLRVSIS